MYVVIKLVNKERKESKNKTVWLGIIFGRFIFESNYGNWKEMNRIVTLKFIAMALSLKIGRGNR